MSEKISPAVIRRLPKYYRYLEELEGKGIDKISSSQMSLEMGLADPPRPQLLRRFRPAGVRIQRRKA